MSSNTPPETTKATTKSKGGSAAENGSATHAESNSDGGSAFADLGLPDSLLKVLSELGYEAPSPIQSATIPPLLAGRDVLGQAQTGTGKTAAFALPVLARLDPSREKPAALVLAPTRELAIQVAEAFHRYAAHVGGFHVLPIYGGQSYGPQLAGLRRGADVVVGTPGRVIDHLNKGTLKLDHLQTLVLDEADEMLRMGFIDDVKNVLDRLPGECQVALFSATMPDMIRRIANQHLKNPEQITIRSSTTTAASIRQRYWMVSGVHKLDALTRMLEVEPFDGMLVFARTRVATEDLARRLEARGFSTAALNGDVPQNQREQIVEKLKQGDIDILVATDVAARGLDVERISHVVNYDIPYDTEAYVHRIGRTGRAGRAGEAILFVAPRERHMLRAIEKATRQPIEAMGLPTITDVNEQRMARFKASIQAALEADDMDVYRGVVRACQEETDASMEDIAAALARLVRGDDHLILTEKSVQARGEKDFGSRPARNPRETGSRRPERGERRPRAESGAHDDADKTRYRLDVGHVHGVKPGNIVGAIANEAGIDARNIGRVDIQETYSLVDLPAGMPEKILKHLEKVWVSGQQLRMRPDDGAGAADLPPVRRQRPPGKPFGSRGKGPDKRPHAPRKTRARPDKADQPDRKGPIQTRADRKAGHNPRTRKKTRDR